MMKLLVCQKWAIWVFLGKNLISKVWNTFKGVLQVESCPYFLGPAGDWRPSFSEPIKRPKNTQINHLSLPEQKLKQ